MKKEWNKDVMNKLVNDVVEIFDGRTLRQADLVMSEARDILLKSAVIETEKDIRPDGVNV